MKSHSYMTRALRAHDPRFAQVLGKLGYGRRDLVAANPARDPLDHDGDGRKGGSNKPDGGDELTAARAAYQQAAGKRPFHGWSIDELKAKIAEATSNG